MAFVFISYSSNDGEKAREVYDYLTKRNIACWMAPQSLQAGRDYPSQIVDGIRNCSAFVLLSSHNTNASPHVSNEVASAFDARKPLIACRLENVDFTDEYTYYLRRKHWIDAYTDFGAGLKELFFAVTEFLAQSAATDAPQPKAQVAQSSVPQPAASRYAEEVKRNYDSIVLPSEPSAPRKKITDRREAVEEIKALSGNYSYSLLERSKDKAKFENFKRQAEVLFKNTVRAERCGKNVEGVESFVGLAVESLTGEDNSVMHVLGMPGSAKNMLLQLAFFELCDAFADGRSDVLPVYVSVAYYEKYAYKAGRAQEDTAKKIKDDIAVFVDFVKDNPEVKPVVIVEGVREHSTAKCSVEMIIAKAFEPLGKFGRLIAIDVGLIKNRKRLKKFIPIAGDVRDGYILHTEPVPIELKDKLLEVIECVLDMYEYNLDAERLYDALVKYKYGLIDIYLIRFIAKELFTSYLVSDKALADIYESMALNEYGDEDRLFDISKYTFEYVFADRNVNLSDYGFGNEIWSLPNKHHTCLEFLLAYYFTRCVEKYRESDDYSFFKMMLTSTANQFIVSMLKDNYELQECFYDFINTKYEIFDARQKSNAAYWLGRLNYNKNLVNQSLTFLTSQFTKLKPLVKSNNKTTQENLDNHFVFRAVCTAMLFHGQANMMDEYLCVVITNDVANAINRGVAIEYFGSDYQMCAFNEYYLDDDPTRGESAMKMLNIRIEKALYGQEGKFVESNLVTLLTLLQARIQSRSENLGYDIVFFVKKALEYLNAYKFKPQNIASGKILFYFDGIKDDLENYLENGAFDVGPMLYNRCKYMKAVKREQWVSRGIDDPESVSEHTFSSWLLAMLMLPEETKYEGYNKREILDMLLIHDMAQTVQGENGGAPVTKKLEFQTENVIMRKFLLKGTYPDVANLTYFYNVWTGFYNGLNVNAKIAQDINLIQSIYTFCEYYCENKEKFTESDLREWMNAKAKIVTEIGYEIYDRMILNNSEFAEIIKE